MDDVEATLPYVVLDPIGEMQADGDAGHRSVHGDGERPADPDEIAVTFRQRLVRTGGKEGGVMAAPPESGGKITDVLGDAARMGVIVGGNESDLHERLLLIDLASGESSNGGPSHTRPVAADPPKLELGDTAVCHEIPIFPEPPLLTCQEGLLQILGVLAGEGRVPGTDALEVVAVGAADLRKVKPAFVQPVDLRGAGAAGDRRVEGLHRVEEDLGRGIFQDPVKRA